MKAAKVIGFVLAVFFCVLAVSLSVGAEELAHPAFAAEQRPRVVIESKFIDPAAALALAESILTTKHGLTAQEARAKLTTNGQLDLARVLEYVLLDQLPGAALTGILDVTSVTVELQHPEPVGAAP